MFSRGTMGVPFLLIAPPTGDKSQHGVPLWTRQNARPRCCPHPYTAVSLTLYLRDGTTGPAPRTETAAGVVSRTASEIITLNVTLEDLWVWQAEGGRDLLHPGYPEGSHFTGSCLCVALEPCWAAVYMVLTAHSLRWTEKGQYALEPSQLSRCLDPYAHCSQVPW